MFDGTQSGEQERPIVVTRRVFNAGKEMLAEVEAGATGPAFENAREKAAQCRAAADGIGAAFWDDVFNYLMEREAAGAGTEIVILEEGESYDFETGKVVRKA